MKKLLMSAFILTSGFCLFAGSMALTNPSHLNSLYENRDVDGTKLGMIHIYSDYPDYKWVDAPGEGISCIDDVARAGGFYIEYYQITKNQRYLKKVKKLVDFVLYLQADNGYFYNFIDLIDGKPKINRTGDTSRAEPNWWSYRALVFLERAKPVLNKKYNKMIDAAADKLVAAIKKNIPSKLDYVEYEGLMIPTFFPADGAADQTAIMVMGLIDYYKNTRDQEIKAYIDVLCSGLMKMQVKGEMQYKGAFLSWKNLWHAYGNNQAYALLCVGEEFGNEKYINAALDEINNFYPSLMSLKYRNYFEISVKNGRTVVNKDEQFAQIAYGIRPMVWACLKAYDIRKDRKYAELAASLAMWFFGDNIASVKMYSKDNGICFDGIDNAKDYNKNSGAESTIEALLALVEIEKNSIALDALEKHIRATSVQ